MSSLMPQRCPIFRGFAIPRHCGMQQHHPGKGQLLLACGVQSLIYNKNTRPLDSAGILQMHHCMGRWPWTQTT